MVVPTKKQLAFLRYAVSFAFGEIRSEGDKFKRLQRSSAFAVLPPEERTWTLDEAEGLQKFLDDLELLLKENQELRESLDRHEKACDWWRAENSKLQRAVDAAWGG